MKNIYLLSDNIISSLGFGTEENMVAIEAYRSGIQEDRSGEIADCSLLAGRIDRNRLETCAAEKGLSDYTPLEQLLILSISDTMSRSEVSVSDCGLLLASTKGNVELLHGHTDTPDERAYLWNTARRVADYFGLGERVQLLSNACISGVSALVIARRLIMQGVYRHVIVAGADVLSHFITSGFLSFKSVSERPCCPYDVRRDGLNLGEACGSVLLSSERYDSDVVLRGGAVSNDANHISGPSRTGDGLFFAMRNALEEAGVSPAEVGLLNLHGTATVYNDEMESKAVRLAGLEQVPVNSLKPYFGHCLGAAGVIETIACAYQMKENRIFGTLNYEACGVPVPLQVSAVHQSKTLKHVVKTASGFGGCNAAIVLSKAESVLPAESAPVVSVEEIRSCVIENSSVTVDTQQLFRSEQTDFPAFIREAFKYAGADNMKFYKMDDLCKLAYVTAEYLLKDLTFEPEETAILLANSASSLDTDLRHQRIIDRDGDVLASPAVFVYTLPNVAIGEIAIRHKIQGENDFFIMPSFDEAFLLRQAEDVMRRYGLKYCVYGWCELLNGRYKSDFRLVGMSLTEYTEF